MYLGSWKIDDQITFTVTTHAPTNGSGQDADAVPLYHVYEDETSTPLITGTMSLLNGANTIGFYSEQFQATAALGFEKGKSYNIYIQAVVGGVTGTINRNFQIEAEVDANRINWANIDNPNTTVMLSGTTIRNVYQLDPRLPAALSGDGFMKSDVKSIDDELTAGNNATLNLRQLNIQNPGAEAVFVRSEDASAVSIGASTVTPGNDFISGLYIFGAGSPNNWAVDIAGLNGAIGLAIDGSSRGMRITSATGTAIEVIAENGGHALELVGSNGGKSLQALQDIQVSDGELTLEAIADSIWNELLSGHLTPGSAGHTLWSRMPTGTVIVGDKTGFYLATPQNFDLIGNITGTLTNVLNVINPVVAGVVTGSVLGNVNGSVGSVSSPVGIATGAFIQAIVNGVWNEPINLHLLVGTTGYALNAAGGAGDPWATFLPGSYVAGQAGHFLASRMPSGSVIVGTNLDKTNYFLGTPQNFNNIGNFSGTITTVLNVTNAVTLSGIVQANVKQINDTTITGDGSSTPWGPA